MDVATCNTNANVRIQNANKLEYDFRLSIIWFATFCNSFILRIAIDEQGKDWLTEETMHAMHGQSKTEWSEEQKNKIKNKNNTKQQQQQQQINKPKQHQAAAATIKFKLQMGLVHLSYALTANMSDGFHNAFIAFVLWICLPLSMA